MSDYAKRVDRASTAVITALQQVFYYVVGAVIYEWLGWTGIVFLCAGPVVYGVASVVRYARPFERRGRA